MKKIKILLFCGIFLCIISGCNKKLDNIDINDNDNDNDNIKINDNLDNNKANKSVIDVSLGQNIEYSDNYSIEFVETKFSETIKPSKTDGYYYYLSSGEGNTYLILKTYIKNLGTSVLKYRNMPEAKLIYNEKYTYSTAIISESKHGNDLYTNSWEMNIDPLVSKEMLYVAEVPKEIETNDKASLIIEYKIDNKVYNLKIR